MPQKVKGHSVAVGEQGMRQHTITSNMYLTYKHSRKGMGSWVARPWQGRWDKFCASSSMRQEGSESGPPLPITGFPGTDSIGSPYGEGFLRFRLSGELTRLDVDSLNEQLRIHGADRLRHSMRPDEAFGLVFEWDDVVFNSRLLMKQAWEFVAQKENLPLPAFERPQLYEVSPERAIMEMMQWTYDISRARELAWMISSSYADLVKDITEPLIGVREWLDLMGKTQVPCALVSNLDRCTTLEILQRSRLEQYFTALVTAEEDMETIAQKYLTAAIKVNRPPKQCVAFTSTPASIAAAHNCTMKSIAVLGPHTAPQLRTADLTVGSLSELSVINLRRLFANRDHDFMELKKDRNGPAPPKRRLTNATGDPFDS